MNENKQDVVIIGAGPAGMTAAIYTARSKMKTLVIEMAQPGGQLWLSEKIENYPGFPDGVSCMNLAADIEKQARKFGTEFLRDRVEKIIEDKAGFILETKSGKEIESQAIIVAAGASMKKLGVKGENKYLGRGVSYCAVCDGPLFRDKVVAVVGGGNTACEEAIYLSRFASRVYLIHRRDKLRAVRVLSDEINENPKIEPLLQKEVDEIAGNEYVNSIRFKDSSEVEVDGVFIFVGLVPSTDLVRDYVRTEHGFIVTDERLMTSVEGIFAAGDCRFRALRQVVVACGEGAIAGEEARKFVEKKKGISYDW